MNQAPNPFLKDWDTPFGIPPFDQIKSEHYLPAFEQAMREHLAEIDAITESQSAASFENTIEALELTGTTLNKVAGVFFNLTSSDTSDELQEIEIEESHVVHVVEPWRIARQPKRRMIGRDDVIALGQ